MNSTNGTVGCAVLKSGGVARGSVSAAFSRSAHVLFDSGTYITLGDSSLAPHPYSVLWPGFSSDLMPGQEVTVTPQGLLSKGVLLVTFGNMETFTPKRESCPLAPRRLMGLALLASMGKATQLPSRGGFHEVLLRCLGIRLPEHGRLAACISDVASSQCSALAKLLRLKDWRGVVHVAHEIAGTGIGLTPAGDDFLAGVLAALRYYGRSLGESICPRGLLEDVAYRAGERTSHFSAFLLISAAEGLVAEPVADWLDAVHRGRSDEAMQKVSEVANLGHSSGLDTLSGMLLALQTVTGERQWTN